MRILVALLFLSLMMLQPCIGDDSVPESHAQAATRLLETMDTERTMMGGAAAMADAMVQQNPVLAPYRDVILEWAGSFMNWETFGPRLVALYSDAFTESELIAISDFYQSPVGRKSLDLMPELMSKGAIMGAEEARKHQTELEQMIRARAAELQSLPDREDSGEEDQAP